MAETEIKVRDNGPLRIEGDYTIVDADGNSFAVTGVTALCRCGQSSKKPFCDATHRTIGFQSAPRAGS
jgi:CDGSH-type Zn-finger protein